MKFILFEMDQVSKAGSGVPLEGFFGKNKISSKLFFIVEISKAVLSHILVFINSLAEIAHLAPSKQIPTN